MQALEQGIQVSIHPPGIEWEKVIGTKDIGASFGLEIRNALDFQLGKLFLQVFDYVSSRHKDSL